jgi:hypothetical protein
MKFEFNKNNYFIIIFKKIKNVIKIYNIIGDQKYYQYYFNIILNLKEVYFINSFY